MRNHPIYPTSGYNWVVDTKTGLPHGRGGFSFFKIILDGSWYTPIIQEYGVTLRWHAFLGFIKSINNGSVPYRELFHIGGPATVRGFKYGQIGPSLLGSSLGATKAFTTSLELQIPITPDGNMRGYLFYDGGAGWDTPDASQIPYTLLQNNNFDYRHAIGFGLSLAQPTPVRVDWAFKLDRKKRRGESLSEVHINMSQSF
jgi:outer membrane protein insertion porin family